MILFHIWQHLIILVGLCGLVSSSEVKIPARTCDTALFPTMLINLHVYDFHLRIMHKAI